MTVSADQIAKAKARGLVNVEGLAAACEHHQFPFYLACTICERETRGRNIFGHDHGGAFSDPDGKNIEVTEARYKEFLQKIDPKGRNQTSNGVGPMQLTYKGYHIGPQSVAAQGLKCWVPADNMLYGVGILARSLKRNYDLGMSLEKAFWQAAKSYNGNSSYADGASERAKFWLTIVGNPDTDTGEDMPTPQEIVDELLKPENLKKLAKGIFTAEVLPPGKDNKDLNDKTWQMQTFLVTTYNRVTELLKGP